MLQWAVRELAARRADAQRDREALRAADKQMASDHDKLCIAAMGAKEGLDFRMQQERRIAELAAREAARSARIALLAQALDKATEALAEARAIYNSWLEF